MTRVTKRVKELEQKGHTFEAADASFELLLVEEVEGVRPSYFDVESWRVITETRPGDEALSEATVKLRAGGERFVVTGEGNGPVNALDHALRRRSARPTRRSRSSNSSTTRCGSSTRATAPTRRSES